MSDSPGEASTDAALPLAVIGGYLGAGKTTFVNRLLREACDGGHRIAVLVNDFGEVSIDADLVVGAEGGVLALAGGCVCCAFGADLVGAVAQMVARTPRPEALLVETSGVGLPRAVARTAALAPGVRIESVTVLADVGTVRTQTADRYVGGTVRQQLDEADLVLLSKADLAGADDTATVVAWLRGEGIAAPAVVLPAPRDAWPGAPERPLHALVFGAVRERGAPEEDEAAWSPRPVRPVSGGAAKPARPAADRFEARTLRFPVPQDVAALGERLRADGVLRAKGVLLDRGGEWMELQVAGGRVHCRAVAAPSSGATVGGADHRPAPGGARGPDEATRAAAGRLVVLTLRRD